ncbi:hypothetical protein Tco_0210139 [Tanacetum coccineum]
MTIECVSVLRERTLRTQKDSSILWVGDWDMVCCLDHFKIGLVFIKIHLGFCATCECDPRIEDSPRGGHPREETRMTCVVLSLVLLRLSLLIPRLGTSFPGGSQWFLALFRRDLGSFVTRADIGVRRMEEIYIKVMYDASIGHLHVQGNPNVYRVANWRFKWRSSGDQGIGKIGIHA